MSNGRFEAYYWNVRALIAEQDDVVAFNDSRLRISDADDASIRGHIEAVLPFQDGSILYAECNLKADATIAEWRYVYVYNTSQGERVFQYDDREHHPEIATHPHHMHKGPFPKRGEKDRAYPIDIEIVSFETVLRKIREQFFSG